MSYSYKPVFLLAFINITVIDENGKAQDLKM